MRRMMAMAEQFGVRLHFFKIANGLEGDCDYSVYREMLERGHDVDCHTYNHVNLAHTDPTRLDMDLQLANALLKAKLGVEPVVIRGPGGYRLGTLGRASRLVILANGFRYVSGQYNGADYGDRLHDAATDTAANPPYRFDDGLVELPMHGLTDRGYFDQVVCADAGAYERWRQQYGHQPVPADWQCPWTAPDALDRWIAYLKMCIDFCYEHRRLYILCAHPYSHYLHDPDNTVLGELLSHLSSKPEPVWTGTLRDVIRQILCD